MTENGTNRLQIGGFSRFSTVDWPGQITATVFLQGCPWRCSYCHNKHLIQTTLTTDRSPISWADVLRFLETRSGLLDGVVFSGGEPLAQSALTAAMQDVVGLGFKIGLHTNGAAPERLAHLIPHLSWVGLDVKAPFADYARVTGVAVSGDRALMSLRLLAERGVPFEVRTTVDTSILGPLELQGIATDLRRERVTDWVVQPARYLDNASSSTQTEAVRMLLERLDLTGFRSVSLRG